MSNYLRSRSVKITFYKNQDYLSNFSLLAKLCIFQGQVLVFRTYLTHQHFFVFEGSRAIIKLH